MASPWYVHKFPGSWAHKDFKKKSFKTAKDVEWYRVDLPDHPENDFYRQAVSYSAFFHGKHRYNHSPSGHIFVLADDGRFNVEQELFTKIGSTIKVVASFTGIWDFLPSHWLQLQDREV